MIRTLSTYIASTQAFLLRHKIWSTVGAVVIIICAWWLYGSLTSTTGQTRYVLGTVSQSTIISTVSGSGQIASSDELTMTPQVSGQVIYVGVTPGEKVSAGTLIAEIDPTEAEKTVRNAQASVASAKLSLAKLQEPATALTLSQAQNQLTQAQTALTTDYQTSMNDITNSFLDLPSIMTGLQNVDFGTDASGSNSQWNIDYYGTAASIYNPSGSDYRDAAYTAYEAARTSYDQTFLDYKSLPASPDATTTEKMLTETYKTGVLIQNAVKTSYALIQFYNDQLTQAGKTPRAAATTHISNLNSYTGKLNPHVSSMLADTNGLASDKSSVVEKQQSLTQTQAGTDPLDIQSAQLSLTQQQNALQDAKDALAKYYVYAPFDGTIASVPVSKYDQASSGTTLATLITQKQIATLSLNEVDAAKIQLGDDATLTFDAVPDLTLTGKVVELDPVGTVSQGVVTYAAKIGFDSQDSRIKPGMTVNADIQTAVHQDALVVPSSAIKTQNGQTYLQVFSPALATSTMATSGTSAGVLSTIAPKLVPVTVGIADDTNTEIVSGATLGEQIVTRTITGTAAAKTTSTATTGSARTGAAGGGIGGAGGIRL